MIKKTFYYLTLVYIAFSFASCTKYAVNWPGENLTSLARITTEDNVCINPFGGNENEPLFFVMKDGEHDKKGLTNQYNIYKKDNPTSTAINQKTSGRNYNYYPTYCAAIDQVAFSGFFEGSEDSDIYMMSASKGKAITQVTNTSDAIERRPCFSKDGTMIVYEKSKIGLPYKESEIWIRNRKTGEDILVGKGIMPSFSPDGQTIVYVKFTSDEKHSCLWIMDIDGDNQNQLTDARLHAAWNPRFSPDGERIVFDSYKKLRDNNDLFIINKDGGDVTQLTINKSYDGQPYWANDGNIYFVSDRGNRKERYAIWRFNMNSKKTEIVKEEQMVEKTQVEKSSGQMKLVYHEVKEGESLSLIAKKYGVTVAELIKWNKLSSTKLSIGQIIKLQVKQ